MGETLEESYSVFIFPLLLSFFFFIWKGERVHAYMCLDNFISTRQVPVFLLLIIPERFSVFAFFFPSRANNE